MPLSPHIQRSAQSALPGTALFIALAWILPIIELCFQPLLPALANSLLQGIINCITSFMPVLLLLAYIAHQNRHQLTHRQRLYYRITLYGCILHMLLRLFVTILP